MASNRRAPRRRLLLLAGLLLCVAATGCGGEDDGDQAPRRVTIDVARKIGSRAKASAEGIIKRPAAVAIRVSSAPKQRVVVTWGLSCPKTADGTAKASGGSYSTRAPNVRALRLPRREIAFCAVRGDVRLTRKGRVKVTLLGSAR